MLSTISNPCDCAFPVPTVTVDRPCAGCGSGGGCGGECGTQYVYATSTSTCPGGSSPPATTCQATVTVHSYPASGCAHTCTSGFCILDSEIFLYEPLISWILR